MAVGKRLRFEVLRRDNYTCRYCGAYAPFAVLEVDHVMPKSRGGEDVLDNLVAACRACNGGKSAMLPEEWLRQEIEQAAREWRDGPDAEPPEDDLREMYAYQEALYFLEELPAGEALNYIVRVFAAARPYRPAHDELVRCAATMAKQAKAATP